MNYTFLDEILLLAGQMINITGQRPAVSKARAGYEVAKSLLGQGKGIEAARHAVRAYDPLFLTLLNGGSDPKLGW